MREKKASRFSLYVIAMGTAFGLGNLWRFPYVVADNGGGAFVYLYIILGIIFATPLLIGEFMFGKTTKKSVIGGLRDYQEKFSKEKWFRFFSITIKNKPYLGIICMLSCVVVMSYFSVVSGWVLHYLVHYAGASFSGEMISSSIPLQILIEKPWLQILLASAHMLLVLMVITQGIEEALEKWVGYIMPIFGFLTVFLVFKSFSLDTTPQALRFFFYPDFTKLKLSSLAHVIGHLCFTLGLGFGLLVTFGSYFKPTTKTPEVGFWVSNWDTFISIVGGLIIFPVLFASMGGLSQEPDLLFKAAPSFFNRFDYGSWLALSFFLCLYLGVLGASLSLTESLISGIANYRKISRQKAGTIGTTMIVLVSIFPALSQSVFKKIRLYDYNLLQILDQLVVNWMLPILTLFISQILIRGIEKSELEGEFYEEGKLNYDVNYKQWVWSIKWFCPAIIVSALVLQACDYLMTILL